MRLRPLNGIRSLRLSDPKRSSLKGKRLRRANPTPGGLALDTWPADERQLLDLVGSIYQDPYDRTRPRHPPSSAHWTELMRRLRGDMADAVRTAASAPTAALDAAQNAVQRAYTALPESTRAAVQQVASEVRNAK